MTTRNKIKKLKNKCDKLWRTIGKETAVCAVCETLSKEERVNYTQLHPHHIIPRQYNLTRWNLSNRLWLCPTHHTLGGKSAHLDPLWFAEWLKKYHPNTASYLKKERRKIYDHKTTIIFLEKAYDKLLESI